MKEQAPAAVPSISPTSVLAMSGAGPDERADRMPARRLHEANRLGSLRPELSKGGVFMPAFVVGVFEGDVDAWKERFLSDPLGRKQVAVGHTLLRGVDNPNEVFVRLEF